MKLQPETLAEIDRLPKGTISEASMRLGYRESEPLLVAMDVMLRYAKAYRRAYESPVGNDGVLGPEYARAIRGIRALLNGDGAVAMERGITTDSKDNGVIEALYWLCCEAAGLDGDTGEPFEPGPTTK